MNNPKLSGHAGGDILIINKKGKPKVVNNQVFVSNYNLSVGNWCNEFTMFDYERDKGNTEATLENLEDLCMPAELKFRVSIK